LTEEGVDTYVYVCLHITSIKTHNLKSKEKTRLASVRFAYLKSFPKRIRIVPK